jgi:nicotinate-nucleotide adenylyltransferase
MKTIAILGGSFSPFHNGHAAMVLAAKNQLRPDEIWLMPSKRPPHKPSYGTITDKDRVKMLKLFSKKLEGVSVCTKELEMEGFTYTADTLEALKEKHPDDKFYFIIGGDSVKNFHNWYRPEVIVADAELAICARSGFEKNEILKEIQKLKETIGGNYHILDFELQEVSSSEIRELLAKGEDVSKLLPAEIYDYITKHKLYLEENVSLTVKELKAAMKELLPHKRYEHVLGVKDTAAELAEIYGVDKTKAKIAGLLHDCAKTLSAEELKNLCDQNGVKYTEAEVVDEGTTKSLLHSKAGSILAKNLYYVNDEEILSSIFYHTVGRPGMTTLEKIIFTADYIEPGRTQKTEPPLDKLRKIAKKDIDLAVYYITLNTIKYLDEDGRPTDKQTADTLEYYKKACNIKE